MNYVFDDKRPIYIQIEEMLRIEIVSGKLRSGDRIPSVRELALMMKVNPNTMQKALSSLEESGLVYTERTNGKFVTGDMKLIESVKRELARSKVNEYLMGMNDLGISQEDAIRYLQEEV